jgi:phosphoglycolate phosphatase-like HAD superfamily hydrolase
MSTHPTQFTKQKQFLVCVDSDGCAMDTMNVKHERFFGPLAADEYGIKDRETFLADWNRINLFSSTRGINRFKALVLTLIEAQEKGEDIGDITALTDWANNAPSLSNASLEAEIAKASSEDLEKALVWSKKVNEGIETELAGEDKPFPGVLEGLTKIHSLTDVAIVSSANSEALNSEWNRHNLMPQVDVVYGQEVGSKADAIADLLTKGYAADEILMVGDAPGDEQAATVNGVFYYPILFGKEEFSWERLSNEAIEKFLNKEYAGAYQEKVLGEFHALLAQFD